VECTAVGDDGSVTIRMTANEARDVRDDFGRTWSSDISDASHYLYRLLATVHGDPEVTR
jgi:hypothetical protein